MEYLTFVEAQAFERRRRNLLSDDEFQQLQTYLLENYQNGDFLQGSGGCQKIRWQFKHKGKSGGVRIIYYVLIPKGRIYLLLIYSKSEQDNFSKAELATMKKLTTLLK